MTKTRHGIRRSKSVTSSTSSPPSSTCCNCFPSSSSTMTSSQARYSLQLSDVYTPCSEHIVNSPSCLTTITKNRPVDQIKTLLNIESEIEYSKNFNKKLIVTNNNNNKKKKDDNIDTYEIASEAVAETTLSKEKLGVLTESEKRQMIRVNGKEELPCVREKNNNIDDESDGNNNPNNNSNSDVKYSTLPLINKSKKRSISIPQRVTQDGTKIYYLCDLPKNIRKGSLLFMFSLIK